MFEPAGKLMRMLRPAYVKLSVENSTVDAATQIKIAVRKKSQDDKAGKTRFAEKHSTTNKAHYQESSFSVFSNLIE